MQLAGSQFGLQRLVNTLLALDTIFSDELRANHNRQKMLAITIEFKMFADHTGQDKLFDLIGMHTSGS